MCKRVQTFKQKIHTSEHAFFFFAHAMQLPCYKELKNALKRKKWQKFSSGSSSGMFHIHRFLNEVCHWPKGFFENFPIGQTFHYMSVTFHNHFQLGFQVGHCIDGHKSSKPVTTWWQLFTSSTQYLEWIGWNISSTYFSNIMKCQNPFKSTAAAIHCHSFATVGNWICHVEHDGTSLCVQFKLCWT